MPLNYRIHGHNNHLPTSCLFSPDGLLHPLPSETNRKSIKPKLTRCGVIRRSVWSMPYQTGHQILSPVFWKLLSEPWNLCVRLAWILIEKIPIQHVPNKQLKSTWLFLFIVMRRPTKKPIKGVTFTNASPSDVNCVSNGTGFKRYRHYKFHFLLTYFERKCFMSLVCTFHSVLSSRLCSSLHKR